MALMTMELSPNLRQLIDDRLETVEKHLLSHGTPRSERLEVVAGLENQIFEMLAAKGVEEPSRRDVLDVLSRLDPPEAFGSESAPKRTARSPRTEPAAERVAQEQRQPASQSVCWVSITGLSVGASLLLLSLGALATEAASLAVGMLALGALTSLICGIVGIVRIRNGANRLRGLPVAAFATLLYPTMLVFYFGIALAQAAWLIGGLAVAAWMNVGFYRLIAIGYRGTRKESYRPREVA